MFDLPLIEPARKPAGDLILPDIYDLTFEGFGAEAFAILERLRAHPHVEQYRAEKEGIRQAIQVPFKRYRDDLVLNWVLPNRLAFETEKNVFSRLLKNDFGAGGCHHHLWMSFYRPGLRRLTDFQLAHSLSPDGFTVGLYVGDYAAEPLRQAKARIAAEPRHFLNMVNPLLEAGWSFRSYAAGRRSGQAVHAGPLDEVPAEVHRADGLWIGRRSPRADVLRWEGALVRHALEAVRTVWPVYRFFAAGTPQGHV